MESYTLWRACWRLLLGEGGFLGKGTLWALPLPVRSTICHGAVSCRYGAPCAEQGVRSCAVNLALVAGFGYLQRIKKDIVRANRNPARGWLVQGGRDRTLLEGTELTCVARPGRVEEAL